MRYPEFLKENGTIGFVAPSFGCATNPYKAAFENAVRRWKEEGFSPDLGPNCFAEDGIGISTSPEKCAREFESYYLRPENDCLISCGGGELMCEILEYIDFDVVRSAKPKWFMGYSDNTNLTFLLTTICDTAAVYGPCATTFGMEPRHKSLIDAMEILTGKRKTVESYGMWESEGLKDAEHPLLPYNCTQKLSIKGYLPVKQDAGETEMQPAEKIAMEGRLVGGCMDCLANLLGTRFDQVEKFLQAYKEDGFVWFLESCDLNVFDIRRAMWQMEQAGWFRYVKGFLIGRPMCHGQEMMGLDQYQAILPVAARHGVPAVMDVDLGHLPPMMPLVSGSYAKILTENGCIKIDMIFR